jgi:site-specific DNA recombinase
MQDSFDKNLRVAIYCRVSTEEQREGQTIESQVTELERFIAGKSWMKIGVYRDEGWSGTLLARPDLDRLRDDASKGLFDAVLINDVDRLARDVSHLGVIKRDLENRGIRVIFRKLPGEQSPTQNLLINILGSFAEFEREMIADRTRRGRRHKVEVNKQYIGSIPPYGFRYITKNQSDSKTGRLEILPQEAAIISEIYRWVDEEGLSSQKVVMRLNALGIPTRKGGDKWQTSSVRRILRSQVYIGTWYFNKHLSCEPKRRAQESGYRKTPRSSRRLRPKAEWMAVPLSEHLRIIEPGVWERVQEQLNRNISFSRRNAKHEYLLAGLLRCGGCKHAYVGDPAHGRFGYRCVKRCKAYGLIRESDLNAAVWNAVSKALQNPDVISEAVNAFKMHFSATQKSSEPSDLRKELERIQVEEACLLQAYRRDIISPEQLARELEALRTQKKLVQSRKPTVDQQSAPGDRLVQRSVEQFCRETSVKLQALDVSRRKRLLQLLLKQIVFEGERVRIIGRIPIANANQIIGDTQERQIAATTAYDCAVNVAEPGTVLNTRSSCGTLLFELIAEVQRDFSTRDAASRANLLKANIARKARKLPR